jgi:hypothetical protein
MGVTKVNKTRRVGRSRTRPDRGRGQSAPMEPSRAADSPAAEPSIRANRSFLTDLEVRPQAAPMWRTGGAVAFLLLWTGCAAAGGSDRPPTPAPAPSSASISLLGFDEAVKLGSDYVHTSAGYGKATLVSSQTLPAGMLELTFDLGPGARPVRLLIDRVGRQVAKMEQVQPVPGIVEPPAKH